jgi:hypothetical protein
MAMAASSLMSVEMLLNDMLYVSYRIPPERLRPHLPPDLKPAEVDGGTFVSLVIFRGRTSGAATVPMPRIPFDQVNIRCYVIDPPTGRTAVYFLHCGISGALITALYRMTSQMPVEHTPFSIEPGRDDSGSYRHYRVMGNWRGYFTINAEETARELAGLPPFRGSQEAIDYFIDPLLGFYRTGTSLLRLEVYHRPLVPRTMRALHVQFPYLTELGIVNTQEMPYPHNLLLIEHTPFRIFLPPKRFSRLA